MITSILESLNPIQRNAVTAQDPHLLVLAGAGSGKTRVLVYRLAWLIHEHNVSPYAIFAVTFTNKAAKEMRARVEGLIGMPTNALWIGTFHGLAHRLLRIHWQDANLPQNFQILDSEDQRRLIRRVMKSLNIDEKLYLPRQAQWYINSKKDEGLRPNHLKNNGDRFEQTMLQVYTTYEEACNNSSVVDFAELLLRTYELLKNNEQLRKHYQQRFEHILVDEFQDTNTIQYAWLQLFKNENNSMMIVGDDDQSIYGWRGAKVENIMRFEQDYTGTKLIRLEQNYRSTSNILNAANALISNNDSRLGKNLWTDRGDGEPIELYSAYDERNEAHYIVSQILYQIQQGHQRCECAVLYRSNAQSRVIEEALIQMNIPYRVYGGMRFFERAEIKDALAYLRLIENRNDDSAFERVINTPTRGIGDRTRMLIQQEAKENKISLWSASKNLIQKKAISSRASDALMAFLNLIERLSQETKEIKLHEQTEHVILFSGLKDHYSKEKHERGQAKLENLDELISATKQFEAEKEDEMTPLQSFLAHASLEAGDAQAEPFTDYVQLMTLHSAKGLEFPIVFIAGLEETIFPHQLSVKEIGGLEEERRLCYVGMTRAMQKLYITYAQSRRLHGQEKIQMPSRFLYEIPKEFLNEVRIKTKVSEPIAYRTNNTTSSFKKTVQNNIAGFNLGETVIHPTFGKGTILNFEGDGAKIYVQVSFETVGKKWLQLDKANLKSSS